MRIAEENETRGSSIAKFRRGSRRSNPGFSESKDINVASISEIRDSGIFERVKKRANVSAHILEVGPGLSLMSPERSRPRRMTNEDN